MRQREWAEQCSARGISLRGGQNMGPPACKFCALLLVMFLILKTDFTQTWFFKTYLEQFLIWRKWGRIMIWITSHEFKLFFSCSHWVSQMCKFTVVPRPLIFFFPFPFREKETDTTVLGLLSVLCSARTWTWMIQMAKHLSYPLSCLSSPRRL